jgi:uncharacterized protein
MDLINEFRVPVPPERAWAILTDLERIAPCMPGAQLQEVDGDEYRGVVKVKVGPITAQYKGVATFLERDEAGLRAVLRAEGRETRGQGNASATITAVLQPADDGRATDVQVTTALTITGKVAQFGRGVLADVSAKLLDQFATSLESTVVVDGEPGDAGSDGSDGGGGVRVTTTPTTRPVEDSEAAPVDLFGTVAAPVAKRLGPLLAAIAGLLLLRAFVRRGQD